MNELALFAGAGGGLLGGHLLGWRTVCAVEWDAYAASILVARQNDGCLPSFPIWDDVQTFDGRPWRGIVDVISGGFPCQDISSAGRGAGIDGERSGMWKHMARIIGEVRPKFVFVENSPLLVSRGLARVLGDLAEMGYDAKWGVLGAHHASAPHKRNRIWIIGKVSNTSIDRSHYKEDKSIMEGPRKSELLFSQPRSASEMANSNLSQCKRARQPSGVNAKHSNTLPSCSWWRYDPAEASKSPMGRMADGVANRVDRLKSIGNGQVPGVVRLAWDVLTKNL